MRLIYQNLSINTDYKEAGSIFIIHLVDNDAKEPVRMLDCGNCERGFFDLNIRA